MIIKNIIGGNRFNAVKLSNSGILDGKPPQSKSSRSGGVLNGTPTKNCHGL